MYLKHTCSITATLHKVYAIMLDEQAEQKVPRFLVQLWFSCLDGRAVVHTDNSMDVVGVLVWEISYWFAFTVSTWSESRQQSRKFGDTTSRIKSLSLFSGIHGSCLVLDIKDFLLKTCLKERTRSLIGPFCCSVTVEAKWCKHSGDPGPEQSIPKMYIDLKGGLLQVCMRCLWIWYWASLVLSDRNLQINCTEACKALEINKSSFGWGFLIGWFEFLIFIFFLFLPFKISLLSYKTEDWKNVYNVLCFLSFFKKNTA